jgi:uncharacterized protein (TIGR02145 family)
LADAGSSSSSTNDGYIGCKDPDETVTIGTQTWLKCNLNVEHNEGNGNSWCYEGTEDYTGIELSGTEGCDKYGRLYDWYAAMDLPRGCKPSTTCAELIQKPHRGICPQGFHIPTIDEWDELIEASGGYSTASSHLKASSGWGTEEYHNGTDNYGFSALPGGIYNLGVPAFLAAGSQGQWWSATSKFDNYTAIRLYMSYVNKTVFKVESSSIYSLGISVRCLKD